LIYRLGFREHITDALISLHWLRVRERIEFKLATLTYKLLHNQAPSYLGPLTRVADVPGRRALRSANTDRLMMPHVRMSSVGNRALAQQAEFEDKIIQYTQFVASCRQICKLASTLYSCYNLN